VGNLGLPLLPPIVLDPGHEETGVGFCLLRIPPLGLKEGIVHQSQDTTEDGQSRVTIQYQVLNPSYLTWPVQNHLGTMVFTGSDNKGETACELEWTVQWTPLWLPIPFWSQVLDWITRLVITTAATYMATLDIAIVEEYHNQLRRKQKQQ